MVTFVAYLSYVKEKNVYECENNPKLLFDETYLNKLDEYKYNESYYVDLDKVKCEHETKILPQKRRDHLINVFKLKYDNVWINWITFLLVYPN